MGLRTKEERNKAEADALNAEEKVKELEAKLGNTVGSSALEAALEKAEATHAAAIAKLMKQLEDERRKLENVQVEYLECKKERNKAENEALEAEEHLRELEQEFELLKQTNPK